MSQDNRMSRREALKGTMAVAGLAIAGTAAATAKAEESGEVEYADFTFRKLIDEVIEEDQAETPAEPTEEEQRRAYMIEACEKYVENLNTPDPEWAANIFAADIVYEDPYGVMPVPMADYPATYQAEAPFVAKGAALNGPVCASYSNEAAVPFILYALIDGHAVSIDIIDVFTFNDEGKIAHARCYWSKENVHFLN